MNDTLLPVPQEWRSRAFIDRAKYEEMYARSIADPEGFWRDAGGSGSTGSSPSPR